MTRLLTNVRRRSLLRLAVLPVVGAVSDASAGGAKTSLADRISLPAETREFRSPSDRYVFTLTTADHWKSRQAIARLSFRSGTELKNRWEKVLPQERGPRHVWVVDSGAVVLMDEWINIPSRHAVMLLAPDGRELADYGIDDIVRLLGVSRRTVADHGKLGIWMSSEPAVSDDQNSVIFRSAGRRLVLRLNDGGLTARD